MKKLLRIIPMFVVISVLTAVLCASVLADASTTTKDTAYKSLDANTEIYLVSKTAGNDYVNYGAKYEPSSGVLYGRVALGGWRGTGDYGAVNEDALADESIVSLYYSLTDANSLEYWSYMVRPVLSDGEHALLIQLNFENEAADCTAVTAKTYDAKLTADFKYLATLSCPVFVRIGGEMNVWQNAATPANYIAAYRHVADLARKYASNVALVFSPNYTSAQGVDMDSYYPGDSYVDWVGGSVFFNAYTNDGAKDDAFYGVGVYGDPMLNVQQIVNLSKLHKKPVMLTEIGAAWYMNGSTLSSTAYERIEKAYAFLTMVYPEIKAIVYSDTNFGSSKIKYQLTGNAVMSGAYKKGVEENPTYLGSYSGKASYYAKAALKNQDWTGTVKLAAYTYSSTKLSAVWSIDGEQKRKVYEYPYSYALDCTKLTVGEHTVTVTFSNGVSKSVTFTVAKHADGWENTDSGYVYYKDGSTVTGWKQIDGKWYYFNSDGIMQTGWQKISSKWYYFKGSGAMVTGWQKISSKWYYFSSTGAMTTGWKQVDNKWYYFDSSGVMASGWKQIGGKWYYLNGGVMTTGWKQIDSKWYYFDTSGVMASGWKQIGGKWYYFGSSGVMTTGWQKIDSKWYYFDASGAMTTGWKQIDSKWYWFDSDGVMATGKTVTISGKDYTFTADGVCTNP